MTFLWIRSIKDGPFQGPHNHDLLPSSQVPVELNFLQLCAGPVEHAMRCRQVLVRLAVLQHVGERACHEFVGAHEDGGHVLLACVVRLWCLPS